MLRRGAGHAIANRWLSTLKLTLAFETPADHERVSDLLSRYDDKAFSYTDAASFVLMERLNVPTAFTFDADFRQYGLVVVPPTGT